MSESQRKQNLKTVNSGGVDVAQQNKKDDDGNGTWTTALHVLLPVALLTLLWGHQGFVTKFFLQFKKNYFPVLNQTGYNKPILLKWLDESLKSKWFFYLEELRSKAKDYWKNGPLLCSLINSAVPGACPYPQQHWKDRPYHGQELAHKYLGIIPIFAEDELHQENLSSKQEHLFINYLTEVQKKVDKILNRKIQYTSHYIARGMGLITGEQYKKSAFYIYPNNYSKSIVKIKSDITVTILGPYGSYCSATVPSMRANKQTEVQKLAYVSKAQELLFKSLSIDLGATPNSEQKITKENNIPIRILPENDRFKIAFIPEMGGMHEISITVGGFHVLGSPFLANILNQSSLIKESLCDEDLQADNCKNNYKRTRKKIISQIIDYKDGGVDVNKVESSENIIKCLPKPCSTSNRLTIVSKPSIKEVVELLQEQSVGKTSNSNSVPKVACQEVIQHSTYLTPESETSSICEKHIELEVAKKKKKLRRQSQIVVEELEDVMDSPQSEKSSCLDVDAEFEELLKTEGYYENKPDLGVTHSSTNSSASKPDLNSLQQQSSTEIMSKPLLKARKSLPNILLFNDYDSGPSLKYGLKFQERQKYWRKVNLKNLDCNDQKYIYTNLSNTQSYKNNNVKSLPNLSDLREKIVKESNSRQDSFTDCDSEYQTDKFRDKFLQCRNYWETLSTQNLNVSTDVSESDHDSGYYASLPNLTPDIKEDSKISSHYKQTHKFWEQQGSCSKLVQNQSKKVINFHKSRKQKSTENVIREHEDELLYKEKEDHNLTDDLKQLERYAKAKNFFKALEKNKNQGKHS